MIEKINKLTLAELNECKDIVNYILNNLTIKLSNKPTEIKNPSNNYLCLMLAPANYNKTNDKYLEYVGKVVYIPSDLSNIINLINAEKLLNTYFNNKITRIVKCEFSNNEVYEHKVGKKIFITVGYPYLKKLLRNNPILLNDSKNTLFIFEEIT